MPRIEHGEQIGDSLNGYRVIALVEIDEDGNIKPAGYAVLDPDGNEVWSGDDLNEAFRALEENAGPEPRGLSGPGM
jgi:hypothetical protein